MSAGLYFYLYFMLMMLIVMNIVIAILMDGYASVKESVNSSVEEQLKHNVGTWSKMLGALFSPMLHRLRFWRHRQFLGGSRRVPWSDERWKRDLTAVSAQRRAIGLTSYTLKLVQLIIEVKMLPTSDGEDVLWQVQHFFQGRDFQPPANINEPFDEPCADSKMTSVHTLAAENDLRTRQLLRLVHEMHVKMQLLETGGGGAQRMRTPNMRHGGSSLGVSPRDVAPAVAPVSNYDPVTMLNPLF